MQKKLKNLIVLSSHVKIFIPKPMDNAEHVKKAMDLLLGAFGGANSYGALASWIIYGKTVHEQVTVCTAYCKEEQLQASIDSILEFCQGLKDEFCQESIPLEINGNLHLI